MKLFRNAAAALIAAAVLVLPACNSSNSDTPVSPVYTDIVTVSQMGDNSTVFTFQKENDSPLITLRAGTAMNKDAVKVGDRVLISYQTEGEAQFQNAEISIVAAAMTYGKGGAFPVAAADTTSNFFSRNVQRAEAWRSGQYLNFGFSFSTDRAPKVCRIVVDEATLTDAYPQLYFIFEPEVSMGMTRELIYYMSYSLSDLFNRSTCQGVQLNYSLDSGKKQITIDKISSTIKPNA